MSAVYGLPYVLVRSSVAGKRVFSRARAVRSRNFRRCRAVLVNLFTQSQSPHETLAQTLRYSFMPPTVLLLLFTSTNEAQKDKRVAGIS